ncbi:CAP domain-containing protein [Holdemanella biformis]|uniref:CAP domain-containing protein n=1 Tax=Holdemanella biformis TaxID=1735 RepID=UPI003079B2DA
MKNEKQKEYESLLNGSSKEQIEQSVNELKTQLESATLAYQEASNRVNELLNAKEEVDTKVLNLQNALESARVELSNAKSDVVNAQNAYDIASADYNEKLEIYNGASDPELKAEYEKQVIEAKNNLTIAQSDLQNAKLIQQSKVDAVANAESSVVEVENEICDLKSLIDAKENELLGINESIGIVEKELSAAKEELTNAIEIENSMQEALNKAQIALDKAKKEVEAQQMNVDKAQSDVDAQQKIVNQLRVDKEQVSQKISLGSKGFFEAYGYTNALKVLEENSVEIGKYTEVGAENDATSLENFKKAIAMVKTGNTLRTTDDNFKGLNPLKVSAEMFAISQVQVNQMAKTEYGHTRLYNVSENIAVGYDDPYVGWYTEEKAVYDYLQKKGWDINDIRDSQGNYIDVDKANEIVKACNLPDIPWVQTGHYTNILKSRYVGTGTAWIEGYTSNGHHKHAGQVFSSRCSLDSLLTIDEFESQFNTYYDSLMNADGAYEDANVILNQLKGELYKQNALLTQKTNDQKVTEQNKVNAENKLNSAKNEVDRLESVVRKKQKNLDDLCSEESTSNIVNEIQKLKALKSNKESLDLVIARHEVENAKKEMAEANVNVNNKEALVKKAQMELDKRNEILEESNKGKETAHNNLKISEAVLKEKGKVLEDTKKLLLRNSQM